MRRSTFKTGLLGLSLGAVIAVGGLSACSNSAQNSTSNQSPTATGSPMAGMPGMDHSNMNGMMMNMDLGPAGAEYDLRFIDAMRLHHRGAIEMAKEAQQKSKRPEIQSLAQNIIVTQNREENELMAKWRKQWYPDAPESFVAYNSQQNKSMPMSQQQKDSMAMNMDLGAADEQFDLRFMNAMISHHEGAISMAKDALQKSKRPEIQKLAQEISTSQQKEIDQMKQWRKAWYNQ
ncbi:hypothetical protein NIES2135_62900 (plasmid) [Leptolyngbya boryana NIES-2135]|jgi:uncharacterized protein (DUF305 family)|uniref:DUF305 domain-containing protein n=1 Tax=Leptolyngbya boryana NIES-2135 TaxID=1973484 RepID=A0A1Z4JRV8_LEPBY|nr:MULTISPECIES: DUF305 domain-containing protein [Leptolyngbya]BAY59413.1 hypothetical protein NIES2135_62900 [Leptolyngbya boryana NIES-2135]MBD2372999.1 DUF305 domain-containing protein [Leptolyngbya sp. FACHB-238]MBD2397248.1 DUF305 domain-containing protein [Leptolyngbya sp. FACHB-239]MBD2403946.1 DUF305 domain-containing protein [Leptolyngbya sp. FACHB-402]ULP33244.1 DUF305 domain-containing protein [Leptolyngbya boryana IU 594]